MSFFLLPSLSHATDALPCLSLQTQLTFPLSCCSSTFSFIHSVISLDRSTWACGARVPVSVCVIDGRLPFARLSFLLRCLLGCGASALQSYADQRTVEQCKQMKCMRRAKTIYNLAAAAAIKGREMKWWCWRWCSWFIQADCAQSPLKSASAGHECCPRHLNDWKSKVEKCRRRSLCLKIDSLPVNRLVPSAAAAANLGYFFERPFVVLVVVVVAILIGQTAILFFALSPLNGMMNPCPYSGWLADCFEVPSLMAINNADLSLLNQWFNGFAYAVVCSVWPPPPLRPSMQTSTELFHVHPLSSSSVVCLPDAVKH